jgi:type IV pilus assembly protein PilB
MTGINQVQVNTKAGLTFASALRSILRQDPDIIMIGEIRDNETVEIAVRAAITGHLVLSTVHTNDTASTITRLTDMGVEPYLISSSLVGIIAQRLVKKICPDCREKYLANESERQLLRVNEEELYIYKGAGCPNCNNSGYRGRTTIAEVMEINIPIKRLISEGKSIEDIKNTAIENGMVTLQQSCKDLVLDGITTIDEYIRNTYITD